MNKKIINLESNELFLYFSKEKSKLPQIGNDFFAFFCIILCSLWLIAVPFGYVFLIGIAAYLVVKTLIVKFQHQDKNNGDSTPLFCPLISLFAYVPENRFPNPRCHKTQLTKTAACARVCVKSIERATTAPLEKDSVENRIS